MRKIAVLALVAALALPGPSARAVLPQDDAGSGTDAPGRPVPTFRIKPGIVYDGIIEGQSGPDDEDWYAFTAPAGARIEARAGTVIGCVSIYDAAGVELDAGCGGGFVELGPARAIAKKAGTYYLRLWYENPTVDLPTIPQPYRFSLGVDGPAPAPSPVDSQVVLAPRDAAVARVAPASRRGDHVVIAVVDTGVNPYHDFFAAPALRDHPSTWLRGFPRRAQPVRLSLGANDYAAATAADDGTWSGLERSAYDAAGDRYDERLYTFPGTRVVAGISFGEYSDPTAPATTSRPVLDDIGHGTHSAGLAGGANLPAAAGNVLIVAVEVGQGSFDTGIRWAARQPWIDAISVSLGGRANAPATLSPLGDRTGPEWATYEANRAGKPVFVASGNGVSNTGVAPDRCTTYTSPYTGPAWVTRVGAAEWDNTNPTWWHCVPVEATARTDVYSPSYDGITGASVATGTSAATPNIAGHFASLLLDARRARSRATRHAVLDHLLRAAAPPPAAPGTNAPSAYPLSLADQGYGLVDANALRAAKARLLSGSGPHPRPEAAEWFARDAALRLALWGPGSATAQEPPSTQDDAGSGGDAPDTRHPDTRVAPGVRYDGMLTNVVDGDFVDYYAFDAKAGDTISMHAAGAAVCYEIVSPRGVKVAAGCAERWTTAPVISARASERGTWYLAIRATEPDAYAFGFALDSPPPPLFP